MSARGTFLDHRRLLSGPWQAFERDVARLMVASGFEDVRVVAGTGDGGADILGVKQGRLWVVQCKFTSNGPPTPAAVDEVAEAGKIYGADRVLIATSRHPGPGTFDRIGRWERLGLKVEVLGPKALLDAAAACSEYSRARRTLRPYQVQASELLIAALRETGRGQVVLATGLGKTVVMAETVAQLFRDEVFAEPRVLVLASTRELVLQLQRAFWDQLPKWVPTHVFMGGEQPSFWEGITFATVQSVLSRVDDLPKFGLVLVDEAHHIGADSFGQVIAALEPPMLGGLTATPWRGDGVDIDHILGPPVFRMGIVDGLNQGFLCEADYRLLADNVDWDFVQQRSRNRYSIGELNRRLMIPTRDEEAARMIRECFDREQRRAGIVFCASQAHAASFAATLRLFGMTAAEMTADSTPRDRERAMAAFRQGRMQVVTTCDLFNEGVDVPDVDLIAFMRVTHSRRIFVQQLGRGLRISPTKDRVVVLDFVTDLRRIAEVIELERARNGDVEFLRMPEQLVRFRDASAGRFLYEWLKDQADLFSREGDATLELPAFDYPKPVPPGNLQ